MTLKTFSNSVVSRLHTWLIAVITIITVCFCVRAEPLSNYCRQRQPGNFRKRKLPLWLVSRVTFGEFLRVSSCNLDKWKACSAKMRDINIDDFIHKRVAVLLPDKRINWISSLMCDRWHDTDCIFPSTQLIEGSV